MLLSVTCDRTHVSEFGGAGRTTEHRRPGTAPASRRSPAVVGGWAPLPLGRRRPRTTPLPCGRRRRPPWSLVAGRLSLRAPTASGLRADGEENTEERRTQHG
ncbi:hypothetical protein BS78_01G482100 [Paspalum vaginatum]|nr:hypothetical protein BS78_01G482100 [Paspalum vaginatum]